MSAATWRIWVDGAEVGREDASISVFDHGFLFGDSVYEVLRGVGRRLVRAQEHLERLEHSAKRLQLRLPLPRAEMLAELQAAVQAVGYRDSYLRLIVTRGEGAMSLMPDSCLFPRRILMVDSLDRVIPPPPPAGIEVAIVSVMRNPAAAVDPAVKSGNYLNSVLALMEARTRGAADGIMCNTSGFLAESTTANLFFVKDGVLCTPALGVGILSGVTRAAILREYAPGLGLEIHEGEFLPAALFDADEAFLSSTLKGVMPICSVDGRRLPQPVPGRVSRALAAEVEREWESLR